MNQLPVCKNDRCSALVPPSKNPGKKREFCSTRCQRRYHARLAYQRERGGSFSNMVFVNDRGYAQVNRQIPPTSKIAEARYKAHLALCIVHGGPCPARSDPYGRKRLCLVAAVFSEDWMQLLDAEEGRPRRRRLTTSQDGCWLADLSENERAAELIKQEAGAVIVLDEEARRAFIEAGGGAEDTSRPVDPAIAKYNEGLPPVSS